MAEAIGLAASIIAVIQITGSTITIIHNYVKGQKDLPKELPALQDEILSLRDLLVALESRVQIYEATGQTAKLVAFRSLLQKPGCAIETCTKSLEYIKKCIAELGTLKGLLAPFIRSKETQWHLERLERLKTLFGLALQSDSSSLLDAIEKFCKNNSTVLDEMREGQKRMADELTKGTAKLAKLDDVALAAEKRQRDLRAKERRNIIKWLSRNDYESYHRDVLDARDAETGHWLKSQEAFRGWTSDTTGMLWIHGIPGAGKTFLLAGLVNSMLLERDAQCSTDIINYFYFTFRNVEYQNPKTMLASIARQIVCASYPEDLPPFLHEMYKKCTERSNRIPRLEELEKLIHDLASLQRTRKIYVLLDALDECSERENLLPALVRLKGSVNLLITSRKEPDIAAAFIGGCRTIHIQSDLIAVDIEHFINKTLTEDAQLARLSVSIKNHIREALMEGAKGMFRWVKCQLDVIRSLKRDKAVREALKNLPKTLDETYERVLVSVINQESDDNVGLVRRIFELVAFSVYPMSLTELAEAVIVDTEEDRLDIESRFYSAWDVTEICTTLMQVSSAGLLSFAHYSVVEYLFSPRLTKMESGAEMFALKKETSNSVLANLCITYLTLEEFREGPRDFDGYQERVQEFPFLEYAAYSWTTYLSAMADRGESLSDKLEKLLVPQDNPFLASALQAGGGGPNSDINSLKCKGDAYTDVIYKRNIPEAAITERAPWMHWRYRANSLHVATKLDLKYMIGRILEKGANIVAGGGSSGTALHLAAVTGNMEILRLFLDHGADINAMSPPETRRTDAYGTPLISALMSNASDEVIELLLSRGASLNIICPDAMSTCRTALHAAVFKNRVDLINRFLDAGAEVNLSHPSEGTALDLAMSYRKTEAAKCLMARGGGRYFMD